MRVVFSAREKVLLRMSSRYVLAAISVILLLCAGCASVARMQRKYEEGDESQLNNLMRIVANYEHSYATRKKAVRALGEIGDPAVVPVLVGVLGDPDPRDGLEKEAIQALSRLGDERAVDGLARVLDRQTALRQETIRALGQIGGARAAEVLVNGLRFYVTLEEQRALAALMGGRTGAFSREEMYGMPPGREETDPSEEPSVGKPRTRTVSTPGGLFSTGGSSMMVEDEAVTEEQEQEEVVLALVEIGEDAVPVLTEVLSAKPGPGDVDIRDQVEEILRRILGAEPADVDGTS